MSKLADFLTKLPHNPALKAKFMADPKGTMKAAGLSDDEIALIEAKDSAGVQARIGDNFAVDLSAQIEAYRK